MPTINKLRVGSTDYDVKDASALHLPTTTPTTLMLLGVDTANAQTNVAVGDGLAVENGTLKATGGNGATIIDYQTTITSEQFDALKADKHSCVYYIDGSDTSGHSLTFRRISDYTQSSKDVIDYWSYDGLGKLKLLTLEKAIDGTVTVTYMTHRLTPLAADGKIPSSYLPAFVNDVLEYANLAAFPTTGEIGILYIAIDTNKAYRWSGTRYSEISASLALGETAHTAYAGDKGAKNAADIATNKTNIATNKSDIAALTTRVQTLESGGTGTSAEAISVDTVNTIAQEIYGV